jgi:hypothetical protein
VTFKYMRQMNSCRELAKLRWSNGKDIRELFIVFLGKILQAITDNAVALQMSLLSYLMTYPGKSEK